MAELTLLKLNFFVTVSVFVCVSVFLFFFFVDITYKILFTFISVPRLTRAFL